MKYTKRIVAILTVGILTGMTMGIAVAAEESSLEGKNISIMTPYLGSVTTNQMVEYIEAKLSDAGAKVSVINTDNDFAELASRVEDTVSSGTDGMFLSVLTRIRLQISCRMLLTMMCRYLDATAVLSKECRLMLPVIIIRWES